MPVSLQHHFRTLNYLAEDISNFVDFCEAYILNVKWELGFL